MIKSQKRGTYNSLGKFILLVLSTGLSLATLSCSRTNAFYDLHGHKVIDNYMWMEKKDTSEVATWIRTQNLTSRKVLGALKEGKWLRKQFPARDRYEEEVYTQTLLNERVFYWKKNFYEQFKIFCTRKNQESSEIILINPNMWKDNRNVEYCVPSPDGRYVAYGVSTGGKTSSVIELLDIRNSNNLTDRLHGNWQHFLSWRHDNSGFYYTTSDIDKLIESTDYFYWDTVYFHQLGNPESEDKKVISHPTQKTYWHKATISEDGKYLLLYRNKDYTNNRIYIQEVNDPASRQALNEKMDALYEAQIIDNKIFIKTNVNAPNGQVWVTDVSRPAQTDWKLFIPESKSILEDITFIDHHLYVNYSHQAHTKIKLFDIHGKFLRELPLPGLGTAIVSGYWKKGPVHVSYQSFLKPKTVFQYHFKENELAVVKADVYQHLYDFSDLETKQVWYKSKDGTPISMFLIHKKNIKKDSSHPVILEGYGGFNISMVPQFDAYKYFMVKQGIIYAIPNLRGGGEYGQRWHDAGKLEKRQNTFDDYISAAEWLIEKKYTNSKRLAAYGASNGGLTIAVAMNQRPDLFKAVVCESALFDMLRYHKFNYAEIWESEYGTSENKEQFYTLYRYSPYHNIKANVRYPDILITATQNDTTVDNFHSLKMAAKLQKNMKPGQLAFFALYDHAGHKVGDRGELSSKAIDRYSFIMNRIGVQPNK